MFSKRNIDNNYKPRGIFKRFSVTTTFNILTKSIMKINFRK